MELTRPMGVPVEATPLPACDAIATYYATGHPTRRYPVLAGTEPERALVIDGTTWRLLMVRREHRPLTKENTP